MPDRLALCFLSACLMISAAQTPPPADFQSEVSLVTVTAVVRSSAGKLMRDLNKGDFELREDGVPQHIQFFARETELPLTLGIVIDVSGSQEKFLGSHKHDLEVFIRSAVRPSDDVFAVCFGNHLRLISREASGVVSAFAAFEKGSRKFAEIGPLLDRVEGTAFYDAIIYSAAEVSLHKEERRRALIVFSDGEDNSSSHDLLDTIGAAQNSGITVYCIRYTQKEHGRLSARNEYGMHVMKHVAEMTGGVDFDALASALPDVFTQIGDELRSAYQFSYVSNVGQAHDGSFRKVTLRSNVPDTSVRTKPGYFAR